MMGAPSIVEGRPDFDTPGFGMTKLRRFPPFVYSRLGGALVHRVHAVEARWYRAMGDYLERLSSPHLVIRTICGQQFYAGHDSLGREMNRTRACHVPAPDAVHCGRCNGAPPTLRRGSGVSRQECKHRLGCVVEVGGGAD